MGITKLLEKYFNRTITLEEYEVLQSWIDSSADNKEQFEQLVNASYLHCVVKDEIDYDSSAFGTIHREIKLRKLKRRLIRISTSVAAVLMISLVTYFTVEKLSVTKMVFMASNGSDNVVMTVFNTDKIENQRLDTFTIYKRVEIEKEKKSNNLKMLDTISEVKILSLKVPAKLDYKVTLEDGTVVWINSDSELRYLSHFAKDVREVFIDGEALFDVAKDNNRPFIVRTFNSKIKVLGTVFNVNSYSGSNESSATLISGKIELSVGDQVVILNPSEKAIFRKHKSSIETLLHNGERDIAWTTGKYYFDAKPLTEILSVLSRWYDVKFTFTSDAVNDLTFTGVINKNTAISDVINMLTETIDFKYVIKDSKSIEIICN